MAENRRRSTSPPEPDRCLAPSTDDVELRRFIASLDRTVIRDPTWSSDAVLLARGLRAAIVERLASGGGGTDVDDDAQLLLLAASLLDATTPVDLRTRPMLADAYEAMAEAADALHARAANGKPRFRSGQMRQPTAEAAT